jgi:general secretion pathway protein D
MDGRHEAALEQAATRSNSAMSCAGRLKPVLLENPKNGKAMLLKRQIDEQVAKDGIAEPTLKAKFTKPVTLQFRDANQDGVEALSRTSGINVPPGHASRIRKPPFSSGRCRWKTPST